MLSRIYFLAALAVVSIAVPAVASAASLSYNSDSGQYIWEAAADRAVTLTGYSESDNGTDYLYFTTDEHSVGLAGSASSAGCETLSASLARCDITDQFLVYPTIIGGDYGDQITLEDSARLFSGDLLYGMGGNDTVSGASQTGDYIDGGDGTDRISGNDGNDTLVPGDSDGLSTPDSIKGGSGSDLVHYDNDQKDSMMFLDCGSDADRVYIDRIDVTTVLSGRKSTDSSCESITER